MTSASASRVLSPTSSLQVAAPVMSIGGCRTAIKPGVPVVSAEVGYADPVATPSFLPVVLRNGVVVEDPLGAVLGLLTGPWHFDVSDPSRSASFGEADLRLANRGGARISAAEISAILERRSAIERALSEIGPEASLMDASRVIPWMALTRLFEGFADIRGVGFSKTTKALHRKRPALIPMLDSVVQTYLAAADPEPASVEFFPERATALVRSYKRDVDTNGAVLRDLRRKLAKRGRELTEVRILDIAIWSALAKA